MKTFVGKVISDRANKTILVAVDRWMVVPKYKKRLRRTSKFMAHDENNECRMGDVVRIHISRPLSKKKTWRMTDILQREKVYDAEAARRVVQRDQQQPAVSPLPGGGPQMTATLTARQPAPLSMGFAASGALA